MAALKYFVYLCLFTAPTICGYRTIKHDETATILAKAGETIDIVCQNEMPLIRCGFTHPNGTKILFVNVVPGTPSCKFTTDAISSEVGVWTCHLWTTTYPQEEIQKTVEVRIAHKFAAIDREVAVKEGDRVTLSCVSSEGMFPLNECHFTTPGHERIHVDDRIKEEHMVLNKYFFSPNRSVHRGDCSLTILSVTASNAGAWVCSSWLELDNREYTDTIILKVDSVIDTIDTGEPSIISITTFVCGSIVFLCMFSVLLYCKQRCLSRFYGKTWGDDDSIENYMIGRLDSTQILVEDKKYFDL